MRCTAAAIVFTTIPVAAAAQIDPVCEPREKVIEHLATHYSESPVAVGLASNGGIVEVLTSLSGQTWTILITMPDGLTCMVAAGEHWEEVPLIVAGPKA